MDHDYLRARCRSALLGSRSVPIGGGCRHRWSLRASPPNASVEAADRDFWSFRKLARPAVPKTQHADRARSPVDAFVLTRLEAQGLTLSAEAPRNVLIRRLWLDLVGLPPPPAAVAEFLADEAPDACARLVDRLLGSPQFGERWGRHWLDVVGYVDTVGFDVDADNIITSEGKWRYRDWVIRAFNADLPYDRFLREQLAGDELVDWRNAPRFTDEIRDRLTATGFLRTAQDFTHEDVGNIPQNHFNILHDTLEIVGSSVLGLTLHCARCHDHKFDPVPQEDYYRLMAAFTPAYNPQDWKVVLSYDKKLEDRALPDVSPADKSEIDRHNAEIERQIQIELLAHSDLKCASGVSGEVAGAETGGASRTDPCRIRRPAKPRRPPTSSAKSRSTWQANSTGQLKSLSEEVAAWRSQREADPANRGHGWRPKPAPPRTRALLPGARLPRQDPGGT